MEDGESAEVALDGKTDKKITVTVSNTADKDCSTEYHVLVKQVAEKKYQATVQVHTGSDDGSQEIEGAEIEIKNANGETMEPTEEGGNVYELYPGKYEYTVSADGYTPNPRTGSFEMGYADRTVDVILTKGTAEQGMLQKIELGASMSSDAEDSYGRVDTVEIQPGIFEYWLDIDMANNVPYLRATLTEEAAKDKKIQIISTYKHSKDGEKKAEWTNGKLDSWLSNVRYLTDRQFTLEITASDGKKESYLFHLNLLPSLSNLAVSVNGVPQELSPGYSYRATDYELTVDQNTDEVEVETVVNRIYQEGYAESLLEPGSYTLSVGGVRLPSGVYSRKVALNEVGEDTKIPVMIRDNATGNSVTYTVTVHRVEKEYTPMLDDIYIWLSNGSGWTTEPDLQFDSETYQYNIEADRDVYQMKLRVDLLEKYKDAKVTMNWRTSDGRVMNSQYPGSVITLNGTFLTDNGPDTSMNLVVESADGSVSQTYSLYFTRNSFLSKLSAYADDDITTALQFAPSFKEHGVTDYQIYVPKDAKTVTIDATPYSTENDSVDFDGEPMLGAVTVQVSDDPEETHTIRVYGEGQAGREYTLRLSRVYRTLVKVISGGESLPEGAAPYLKVWNSAGEVMEPDYEATKELDQTGVTVYDLPVGTYTYEVYLKGYERTKGTFETDASEGTAEIDMTKYPEGERTVTLNVTHNGEKVEDAKIQVVSGSKIFEPVDGSHTFSLESQEGYKYQIRAKGCQYTEGTFDVTGEDLSVDVELEDAKSAIKGNSRHVKLTVLDIGGEPVKDAEGREVLNVPLDVSYFDLSQYYMHDYVWDDTYDEASKKWVHNEGDAVNPNPTMLHLMIQAYEELMETDVEFGTSALNLEEVNESMSSGNHWECKVLSYWGIAGNVYYWFNNETSTKPDSNVYTKEIPDNASITIQLYEGTVGSKNYYIAMEPEELTVNQGSMAELALKYSSSWGTKPGTALTANPVEMRMQEEDGSWGEWQKQEEVSDSSGVLSYFFDEPGIYQFRAAGTYSVSGINKANRLVRIPATVTVQEAELRPVDITFKVTDLDEDITASAQIEVKNSKGEVQPLKDEAIPGVYALMPGRYTYTVANAEGAYPRSVSFIVVSGQEPTTFEMELREELLLSDLRIGNSTAAGEWVDIGFDSDGRGIFSYSGSLYDTATNGFLKFALKDGVDTKTVNMYATYTNSSGTQTEVKLSPTLGTGRLTKFLAKGMEGNTVVITVETPEKTQNYTIEVGRIPTLGGFSVMAGNKVVDLSEKFSADTLAYETEVPEDTEAITIYPKTEGEGYEVLVEGGKETEPAGGGSVQVTLNDSGDTELTLKVAYQKDAESEKLEGTAYTLTVKRVAYEEADPLIGSIGFFDGMVYSDEDVTEYGLNRPFNPAVYEYTLYLPDSVNMPWVGVTLNGEDTEDVEVSAKFLSASTGQYDGPTEIEPIGKDNDYNSLVYGFTTAGGEGGEILNIEARKGNIVQTYVFRVELKRRLSSLKVEESGKYGALELEPKFNVGAEVFEYHTTVSAAAAQVKVTAGLSNDKWYDTEDGSSGMGYKLSVNGQRVYSKSTAVTVELTKASTKIPIELTYKDELPVTYTLVVEKLPDANVDFTVEPADASIIVTDEDGNIIEAKEEDRSSFLLSSGETYTYIVSKLGYVGKKAEFTAEDGLTLEAELEKAKENPDINPDIESEWNNFRGNENNNGVTEAKTPTTADDAMLYWAVKSGDGEAWENGAPSSPILVGGYLYFYSTSSSGNSRLLKMDKNTGEVVDSAELEGSSSFGLIPPTYADGMIFVALAGGTVQAFNADTLESLWIYHDTLSSQPNSPITYHNGYLYIGFWSAEDQPAHMVCLSATDEDPEQELEEKLPIWMVTQEGGFYWAGAYACDTFVLVGTDDGVLEGKESQTGNLLSLDPVTGKLLDKLEGINGDVRSSVVYDEATDSYYFTSKGGSFYCVRVNEDGTFAEDSLKELKISNGTDTVMITSTPVISNGRAYFGFGGGAQFTQYGGHGIAVIDLTTFTVAYTANTKGYPQSSGLLTTGYDGTAYVYFVDNYTPGSIRVIADKPGQTALADPQTETYVKNGETIRVENCAPVLFTPKGEHAQYAVNSLIVDEDGTLYFRNDSKYIFAVGSKVEKLTVEEQPEKSLYVEGETFDPAGMKVIAELSNGIKKDVTELVTYPSDALTKWDISIQLSYDHVLYNDQGTAKKPTASIDILVVTKADMEKVDTAVGLIEKIGDPAEVTLASREAIEAARAAYEEVLSVLKNKVTNYSVLQQAEEKLRTLEEDQNAIDTFNKLVEGIGAVTLEKEALISEAEAFYKEMTEAQKKAVKESYGKMKAAREELERQKEENAEQEENEKKNQEMISEVEQLIGAIGYVDAASGDKIRAAREAFERLPKALQERISNYSILQSAEQTYQQIVEEQDKPEETPGGDDGKPGETPGGNDGKPGETPGGDDGKPEATPGGNENGPGEQITNENSGKNDGEIESSGTITGGRPGQGAQQNDGGVTPTKNTGSKTEPGRTGGGVTSGGRITGGKSTAVAAGQGGTVKTSEEGRTDGGRSGERVRITAAELPEGTKVVLTDVEETVKAQFTRVMGTGEKLLWISGISLEADGAKVVPEGAVEVSVWVGTEYDGQTLKALQAGKDGQMTEIEGTVKDGYLVFTVSELGAVAVIASADAVQKAKNEAEEKEAESGTSGVSEKASDAGAQKIETGSTTARDGQEQESGFPAAAVAVIVVILLLGAAAVLLIIWKKRLDAQKK